jgi:glycosyltransferase involved in cell wall biosynthesis
MRILFLTQVLPYPLDAGPKVRAYYVLRHLAQKHSVTLVSFVRPSDTADAIAHLRQFCAKVYTVPIERARWRDAQNMLQSLLTNKPFLIVRDQQPAMQKLLATVIQEEPFDAIHADQLWMASYALSTQALAPYRPTPLTVLDQHNAVFMIPQRMGRSAKNPLKRKLLDLEAHKLARYEREICSQIDKVVWVTQDDYDAVARAGTAATEPLRNAGVIPICTESGAGELLPLSPRANRVTFLGGLHYPPNAEGVLWFAKAVFPAVLAAVPDARLTVIGKQPPAALLACNIPPANLDITGYVDDPRPYLTETAAFIVPILAGGGMRVKILDSWKWGLPVISTTIGAEGIQITPKQDILIADSAEDFATAAILLLRNPSLGRELACAAQATLRRAYDWRNVYRGWDSVYTSSR